MCLTQLERTAFTDRFGARPVKATPVRNWLLTIFVVVCTLWVFMALRLQHDGSNRVSLQS